MVQYRVSPTVADDADEQSWLTVLSSDDTTKDWVTMSWVLTYLGYLLSSKEYLQQWLMMQMNQAG